MKLFYIHQNKYILIFCNEMIEKPLRVFNLQVPKACESHLGATMPKMSSSGEGVTCDRMARRQYSHLTIHHGIIGQSK